MSKLSTIQQKFLSELFGAALGNAKLAAKNALGSEDYSSILTPELISEIKQRADKELALQTPKAVFIISKMLDDPENAPFMDKLHKVAADVLDRAGISKQERAGSSMLTVGVVMLPSKAVLPEPPTIENEKKNDGPVLLTAPIDLNAIQTQSA